MKNNLMGQQESSWQEEKRLIEVFFVINRLSFAIFSLDCSFCFLEFLLLKCGIIFPNQPHGYLHTHDYTVRVMDIRIMLHFTYSDTIPVYFFGASP